MKRWISNLKCVGIRLLEFIYNLSEKKTGENYARSYEGTPKDPTENQKWV